MLLREYGEEDLEEILRLFYRTVHVVAAADYSEEQLDAWAPAEADREKWRASLAEHFCLVAEENGKIVAFGDAAREVSSRELWKSMRGRGERKK